MWMRRTMGRKERKMGEGNHWESKVWVESWEDLAEDSEDQKGQHRKSAEETLNNKQHQEDYTKEDRKKGRPKTEERINRLSIIYWNF